MSLAHLLPIIVSTSLARGFGLGILGQSIAFGLGASILVQNNTNKTKTDEEIGTIALVSTLFGAASIKTCELFSQTSLAQNAGSFIASKITNPEVMSALCSKFTQGAAIALGALGALGTYAVWAGS